jgi:hemerythrin-like domain-containing protein
MCLQADPIQPDIFQNSATVMALIHTTFIRALNAIYLQAPHVTAKDQQSFCQYIAHLCQFLQVHHDGEEAVLFLEIEKLSGERGLMTANVEQHHAFHDGLQSFSVYVQACLSGKEKYDGRKIVSMIDGFGTALVRHLHDEIQTLLALSKYGDKLRTLPKLLDDEGTRNLVSEAPAHLRERVVADAPEQKTLGIEIGLVWVFDHMDLHYENGLWVKWPPAPSIVRSLLKSVTYLSPHSWRKFSPCDRAGKMRPLYAVPENKSA